MKTISIKLFTAALLVMSAVSCKENKLPVYNDVSRVYFSWARAAQTLDRVNNTIVSLGYDSPMKADSTIRIKIKTIGRIYDVDRLVAAAIIRSESTAVDGEDIEILGGVIPADSIEGEIRVRIINTEKLLTNTLHARIRLVANEYFHVDWNEDIPVKDANTGGLEYNISFDAKTDMPNLWKDARSMTQFFGPWSRVKELAIYDALGVTREFFTYDPATENANTVLQNRMPNSVAIGMIGVMNRYLKRYEEEHGAPMRDENDTVVTTGMPTMF